MRSRATADKDGRLEADLATFRLLVGYQNPLPNSRTAMRTIAGAGGIPQLSGRANRGRRRSGPLPRHCRARGKRGVETANYAAWSADLPAASSSTA